MGLSFPSYFSPIPMRRFHSKVHACIKVGQTHIKVKGLAKESTFLLMLKEKAMDYYTMYRDDHTHEHDHGKDISIIYGCNHGTLLPKNKNHGTHSQLGMDRQAWQVGRQVFHHPYGQAHEMKNLGSSIMSCGSTCMKDHKISQRNNI